MHWHAFSYSGASVPPDAAAKDPNQAVMPIDLTSWFSKPRSMHKGAYGDADSALEWLAAELEKAKRDPERLPAELAYLSEQLSHGQDAYSGFYASGSFHVRCMVACPRSGAAARPVRCPGPPQ